ncbi:putative mitochondrial protein [Tanacetum coccineum]
MASFKNAKYDKTAKEYQDTFDNLLSRVEVSDEHVISLYLGGLPTELEMSVRMFRPKTFYDAYCLTTLQEATLEVVKKSKPFGNQITRRFGVSNLSGRNPIKQLTQKEYEDKRSKKLRFYCDQKCVLGHKCSGQLYSLIVLADNEDEEEEYLDVDETVIDAVSEEVQAHISLNALSGVSSFQTMGVIGLVAKQHELQILIDSGSTHNFSDVNMAKRKGCKVWSTYPLAISIPGRKQMVTVSECKDFQWQLYGHTFTADVMLLPLGECDMVLEVFAVPNKLPPVRTQDHRISLMPGTQPVNIRPYRHPSMQNDAIEAIVKELLASGVIKHNQSSFASPVVMVKKKDNSWRMCVDYWQLNKHTIKDKFSIPIIEELIDELCGPVIFTKLDLRSDYHQIRMYEDDIAKTPFRTHAGHYEFYKSLEDHIQHLTAILSIMKNHSLYAKEGKCVFGTTHVEYLGHVLSAEGVATDPTKIQAMPLTQLLKKNSFEWNNEAQQVFIFLKEAIIQAPVLALPNFNNPFVVETNASGIGLGAILQQEGHPVAYMSKYLAPKHQALSTYEKEFLAVLMLEVFVGLEDYHTMKWLPKLIGFDYEVEYKKGTYNAAADALSRKEDINELFTMSTTSITTDLYKRIEASDGESYHQFCPIRVPKHSSLITQILFNTCREKKKCG